jgi:hypothetical protein
MRGGGSGTPGQTPRGAPCLGCHDSNNHNNNTNKNNSNNTNNNDNRNNIITLMEVRNVYVSSDDVMCPCFSHKYIRSSIVVLMMMMILTTRTA